MTQVTCSKCGTVAFEIKRQEAEAAVLRFNTFFATLSVEERLEYYNNNKSHIIHYEKCWCGNSYKKFQDFKEGDCPDGSTLSPIIVRSE